MRSDAESAMLIRNRAAYAIRYIVPYVGVYVSHLPVTHRSTVNIYRADARSNLVCGRSTLIVNNICEVIALRFYAHTLVDGPAIATAGSKVPKPTAKNQTDNPAKAYTQHKHTMMTTTTT